MANACDKRTKQVDTSIQIAVDNYKSEAVFKVHELIGYPDIVESKLNTGKKVDKLALKAYNRLKQNLLNQLNEIGKDYNWNKKYITMKYNQWLDVFQKEFGTNVLYREASSMDVDPHILIAADKLVAKYLHLQKTRFGKDFLPQKERELLPVEFFTMRNDFSGAVHDYIKTLTSMVEESRRKSSPFKSSFNDVYTKLNLAIDNILSLMGNVYGYDVTMVDKNMSVDDIINTRSGIDNVSTVFNEPVIFLGTIKKGNDIFHDVILKKTNERVLLPRNEINNDEIRDGIKRKYAYELIDEIMNDQTRYVEWSDNPTQEDKKEIQKILTKWDLTLKVRKATGDTNKTIRDVHFGTYKGHKVAFVMIKHPIEIRNNKPVELWKAYIISHTTPEGTRIDYFSKKDSKKRLSYKNFELKNGFYRAIEYKNHGINYTFKDEKGWYFGNNAFDSYMKVQPNELIMNMAETPSEVSRLAPDKRLEYGGIFTTIQKLRGLYEQIGSVQQQLADKQQKMFEEWFGNNAQKLMNVLNRFPGLRNKKSKLTTKEAFDMLKEIFLIDATSFVDDKGNTHTNNSFFEKMSSGYITRQYRPEELDSMLDNEIENIKDKIAILEDKEELNDAEEELLKNLYKSLRSLQLSQIIRTKAWEFNESILSSFGIDDPSGIKIYQRNLYAKTRSQWVDPTRRITDQPSYSDYLDNVFYGYEKNVAMFKGLELIDMLSRHGGNSISTIEYTLNRAMASTASDKVKSRFFNADISYDKVAKVLSTVNPFNTYTSKDAEKIVKTLTSVMSSAILGTWPALGNRTQDINIIGYYGYDLYKKAEELRDDEDPVMKARINAIIDNTGALESLLMFTDVIADATQLTLKKDMSFVDLRPIVPIVFPRPFYLNDINALRKYSMKGFVEKGIPKVDEFLNDIEMARIDRNKNQIRRIELMKEKYNKNDKFLKLLDREEKRLHGELDKRDIRYLRELYYKLVLTPRDSKNYPILQARFYDLVNKVSDTRLKRILGWKLGKAPLGKKKLETFLTMTKGEEDMTRATILAAILDADKRGLLGSSTKMVVVKSSDGNIITDSQGNPVKVYERLLSPLAVRIARNAVNNIMFRMSPQHLGDAFLGAGKGIMLYKGYQINQMIYDYQALKNLIRSSASPEDFVSRISKAVAYVANPLTKRKDISNKDFDQLAVRAARSLILRGGLTALAVGTEFVPILNYVLRSSPAFRLFGISARGGENILYSLPIRLFLNALVWSVAGDDYDVTKHDLGWGDLFRLFMPVLVSFGIMSGIKIYKWLF